jgi:hypothetical protein
MEDNNTDSLEEGIYLIQTSIISMYNQNDGPCYHPQTPPRRTPLTREERISFLS